MQGDEETLKAIAQANRCAYLAGRLDQLARSYAAIGNTPAASECARRKKALQMDAENIINLLPIVVA